MTPSIPKISAKNCHYRGEGNACLVVRLKSSGKDPIVLRLVKESISSLDNVINVQKQLEDYIAIVQNIMQPLLGDDIVHCPFMMPVSSEEVKIINKCIENCRPSHRWDKVVKERNTYALVLPDHCSLPQKIFTYPTKGPVITVEIKPKQGFLQTVGLLSSHKQNPPLCKFCMMQCYKLQKNMVSKRSGYCPLDLYSGCPKRMHHAIKSLFHTPQNNFRIFKNEELVYSEERKNNLSQILKGFSSFTSDETNTKLLTELIVNALLKHSDKKCSAKWKSSSFKQRDCTNSYVECSHPGSTCPHQLPESCVLYRILKLQKLDHRSIQESYPYYLEAKQVNYNNLCRTSKQMIGILPQCYLPNHVGEEDQATGESDIEFASRKVWEYLLSLTLKDCSLMLTFKSLDKNFSSNGGSAESNIISDKNGNNYLFSIAIIDLDMKTINKVEASYRRRASILQAYFGTKKDRFY